LAGWVPEPIWMRWWRFRTSVRIRQLEKWIQ